MFNFLTKYFWCLAGKSSFLKNKNGWDWSLAQCNEHVISSVYPFLRQSAHLSVQLFWPNYSGICRYTIYNNYAQLEQCFQTKKSWPATSTSCLTQKSIQYPKMAKMGVHWAWSHHYIVGNPTERLGLVCYIPHLLCNLITGSYQIFKTWLVTLKNEVELSAMSHILCLGTLVTWTFI